MHISHKTGNIYECSEFYCYCSEKCLISSRYYLKQLEDTPIYMRTGPVTIQLLKMNNPTNNSGDKMIVDSTTSLDMKQQPAAKQFQIIEKEVTSIPIYFLFRFGFVVVVG